MDFPFQYPGFEGQQLTVKADFGSAPKLWCNGVPAERRQGAFVIKSNAGKDVAVQLKPNLLDLAVPKVIIGQDRIELVAPLKRHEQVVMFVPLLLIFTGGAVGGALGAAAVAINSRIFRSGYTPAKQYGLIAATFVATVLAYLFVADWIQTRFIDTP